MKYIIVTILILLVIYLIVNLLKQSKNPNGYFGKKMITIWNKTYEPLYHWALSLIDRSKHEKILDIGIGGGTSTKYLANFFLNSHVVGIDHSTTAIEIARETNKENIDLKNVGIIQGDVCHLGLKRNEYDLVTAFQTHFTWLDFPKAMHEIFKVMNNDGTLILACEKNKLNYHLKEYDNLEKLTTLTKKIGYSAIEQYNHGSYICFIITK